MIIIFKNWALLTQGDEILWKFGNIGQEAENLTLGFLKGLHNIGKELFDKGIASLHFRPSSAVSFQGDELFIINLEASFFLIIFDPIPTITLLNTVLAKIPTEIDDKIRSVLIGQATLQYGSLCGSITSDSDLMLVDTLFQTALNEILSAQEQERLNVYVGNESCSFSGLTSIQCLVFHYILRELFEKEYTSLIGNPWSIIQDQSAIPVHLSFHSPKQSQLLSGYLTIINDYVLTLFNTQLRSLVFGGSAEIASIDLVHGQNNFMSISNPYGLFKNHEFLDKFSNLDAKIVKDLSPNLKEYLATQLSGAQRLNHRNKNLNILIYKLGDPEL